jgi:REP element-mobilizing transposase RayT
MLQPGLKRAKRLEAQVTRPQNIPSPVGADFAWQAGYGEFSVSPMHIEPVREYIRNQAEHHKREDFQAEYRRFSGKITHTFVRD